MRDVILCLTFMILLGFSLRRPWLGILMLACISYLNPQRLCFGFAYALPFFMVTVICTVVAIIITGQWPRFFWTREIVVLLALIAWMNITFLTALNPVGAYAGWNQTMKIMATLFLAVGIMQDRRTLTLLLWVISLSIGFYGAKGGLFTILTGGQSMVVGPADSFLGDNNQLAVALCMALPLMRYLQLQLESTWLRRGMLAIMFLNALAVLGTYSRGGFLSLGIVALVMWMKSRRKLVYATAAVVCGAALLTVMPEKWTARMQTIQSQQYDGSVLGRFNAWHFAMNLAQDRPLVGGGFHSFTPELFRRYAPDPDDYHVAHSIYFEMLGDQGYPGLMLFVLFFVLTWLTASRTRRRVKPYPNLTWAGEMTAMLQTSLAAYLVGGAFLSLAYFDLPYQIALTVVTCSVVVKRELRQSLEFAESGDDPGLIDFAKVPAPAC